MKIKIDKLSIIRLKQGKGENKNQKKATFAYMFYF